MSSTSFWASYRSRFPEWTAIDHLVASIRADVFAGAVRPGEQSLAARIDVEAVATLLGCQLELMPPEHARPSHLASLVPRANRVYPFEVRVNEKQPRVRLRFSIAHEVGHVFFFDRDSRPPRRFGRATAHEERFCDEFASELLLPGANVPAEASLEKLVELALRLDVSVQVAAMRALRHSRLASKAVIGLAETGKPSDPRNRALRVQWAVTVPGVYVPRWLKYRNGPAREAWEEREARCASVETRMGSLSGSMEHDAVPVGRTAVVLAVR
jgi:hypothetical protein